MDSDVVHLITCAVMSVVEIVAIVTSSLALGGGNWIESVTGDGLYKDHTHIFLCIGFFQSNKSISKFLYPRKMSSNLEQGGSVMCVRT